MENNCYVCEVCGHIHDEEQDGAWADVPKYWNCPECGAAKEEYKLVE